MIRLVSGDDKWSGQVEIYRHDAWGAVCDSSWDMKDATTVCHQLGFIEALEAKTGLSSRESDRPIVMNRVACTGTERRLADCPFVCTGSQQCSSSTVAGVVCKPRPDELRLVGGSRTSGRVEIYRGGSWGTICDSNWNETDAGIVCRQLGFSDALEAKSAAHFGQGSGPVHMDGVACEGSEEKITDCPSYCWEETSCSHSHDAGVICSDGNTVTTNK
ncbi:scavenger receptor cysteine-rich domain-containing group B protein-like [Patiria miniata]|uniref:SRCR domain-containing protein n=1 Tax=Patiria miniata TaxID=46514 RepID=A0A914ATX9_PATMI|nr:scavenger receptor cysteine-rich domain-containing group B protein-like [Patiria miniata]